MNFQGEQSDDDRLHDQVYAAMETGNTNRARALVASHLETFPDAIVRIRRDVLADYGVSL